MTAAKNIRPGDRVRINGRTVTVTRSELGKRDGPWWLSDGKWSISWASGTASGMHRCPPKQDVQMVYKPKPRWSW